MGQNKSGSFDPLNYCFLNYTLFFLRKKKPATAVNVMTETIIAIIIASFDSLVRPANVLILEKLITLSEELTVSPHAAAHACNLA